MSIIDLVQVLIQRFCVDFRNSFRNSTMCNFACLVALGVLNVTNSAVSFYIHSPNSNFDFARCMSFLIETHLHDRVHYQLGHSVFLHVVFLAV